MPKRALQKEYQELCEKDRSSVKILIIRCDIARSNNVRQDFNIKNRSYKKSKFTECSNT